MAYALGTGETLAEYYAVLCTYSLIPNWGLYADGAELQREGRTRTPQS
jgi:hypothetical protein